MDDALNHGRVRIVCVNGEMIEAELPCSWEQYCLLLLRDPFLVHPQVAVAKGMVFKIMLLGSNIERLVPRTVEGPLGAA